MIDLKIWRAGPQAHEALGALEQAAFGDRAWAPGSVGESLGAPGVEVWLAGVDAHDPSGFLVWRRAGDDAEILNFGVRPADRRQGVGRALLGAFVATGRAGGAADLVLEVDTGNRAAIALYTSAGFICAGRRPRYYRDGADALIMRRPVGE